MSITFANAEETKKKFIELSQNPEATTEQRTEALENWYAAMEKEKRASILEEARATSSDNAILQARGHNVLTSEERKFFNEVIDKKGFDDDSILPVTTQERIFEEVRNEHPLLNALGIRDAGAVTRIITSDPDYAFVWGKLFGPIQGQIGAGFKEETVTQLKVTAYAVVPNDMLELGPEWVERYVRETAVESISLGLEYGFVRGGGPAVDEPIGLLKEVNEETGAVTDKAPAGTLTFEPGRTTIIELKNVVKGLSRRIKQNGEEGVRRVAGKIVMVVNPFDYFDIVAASTTQNANGVYVTNLPFNPQIVESEFVPEGQVVFFVRDEYLAYTAGGYRLKKFDQTLAMEDATLYTIKQFAVGKPRDNNATAVYTLNIADGVSGEPAGA